MRCRFATNVFFLVSALSFSVAAAPAQEDASAPIGDSAPRRDAAASERVDVDVVNVDVYVTDKKGSPVTHLTQDDFQVFEDQKKVKLTNFLAEAEFGRQELGVVVYVDVTQLSEASRRAAVDAADRALESLMAEGSLPVMVVGFDGLMHLEQDFTTDFAKVSAGLHRVQDLERPPSESIALERATRATVDETMQLFHAGGGSEVLATNTMDSIFANVQGYADVVHRETVRSVDGLTAFASALGARPGRKAVFVVADGIVMRPLEELTATLMRQLSRRGSGSERAGEMNDASSMQVIDARPTGGDGPGVSDFTDAKNPDFSVGKLQQGLQPYFATARFEQLAAIANSARVTLYPIRPPQEDAASTGLGNRPGGEGNRPLSDTQEGLVLMADSTGGRAFLVGEDVSGFVSASLEDTSGYYSLGFAPRDKTEGKLHTIEVKAKGGVKLRHRSSYVTKTGLGRLADRAVGALTLGWVENPHEVEISVDKKNRADDGNWDVSLVVQFPIAKLELQAANGIHQAAGKVAVVVLNSRGELSRPQFMDLPLQIPDADLANARQQYYGARVNLRLPPGPQKVAIGLWDETALVGSFISQTLEVGS
jgi:VWFA-related protein